jgi:hypothetical protein
MRGVTRAHVIHLHRLAPAKPAPGDACNGCGVCCAAEPCPLGIVVSRRRRGACAALRWDDAAARYRCALLPEAAPAPQRRLVARWIAAGAGCDCDLDARPATA